MMQTAIRNLKGRAQTTGKPSPPRLSQNLWLTETSKCTVEKALLWDKRSSISQRLACRLRPTRDKYIIILALFATSGTLHANPTFEVSTFTTGTDGWEPNSPWITSTAMPIAPGDPYLLLDVGANQGNRGSKLITFNPTEAWTGNYFGASVTGVSLDVANWSDSDTVHLRVVVGNRANPQQSGGTWWISDTATTLQPGQDWTHVQLSLFEEDLVRVGNLEGDVGTDSYADTFSNVQTIRILSAVIPLGAIGDEFVGPVGMDNIGLIPEPSTYLLIGLGIAAVTLSSVHRKAR